MLLDKALESHPLEPNVELPPPSLLKRKIIIKNKKKHHHHHHHHHKKNNAGANATANTQNNINNSASGIRSSLNQTNILHDDLMSFFFYFFSYSNLNCKHIQPMPSRHNHKFHQLSMKNQQTFQLVMAMRLIMHLCFR